MSRGRELVEFDTNVPTSEITFPNRCQSIPLANDRSQLRLLSPRSPIAGHSSGRRLSVPPHSPRATPFLPNSLALATQANSQWPWRRDGALSLLNITTDTLNRYLAEEDSSITPARVAFDSDVTLPTVIKVRSIL